MKQVAIYFIFLVSKLSGPWSLIKMLKRLIRTYGDHLIKKQVESCPEHFSFNFQMHLITLAHVYLSLDRCLPIVPVVINLVLWKKHEIGPRAVNSTTILTCILNGPINPFFFFKSCFFPGLREFLGHGIIHTKSGQVPDKHELVIPFP